MYLFSSWLIADKLRAIVVSIRGLPQETVHWWMDLTEFIRLAGPITHPHRTPVAENNLPAE